MIVGEKVVPSKSNPDALRKKREGGLRAKRTYVIQWELTLSKALARSDRRMQAEEGTKLSARAKVICES